MSNRLAAVEQFIQIAEGLFQSEKLPEPGRKHLRYPDHSHPPEEAYILLTPGEFRQLNGEWFDPGIGGGIHNAPSRQHAMKSGSSPFLALWCLLI